MDTNFIVPRLCYEVLNIPLSALADNLGLSESMLQKEAAKQGWIKWFPEDDNLGIELDESSDLIEGEDIFSVKANQFLDKNRKKLQVFNLAKSLALAQLHAQMEVSLLDKLKTAIASVDPERTKDLHALGSLFKTLTKDLEALGTAISVGQDESGLPTVILRDLSGTPTHKPSTPDQARLN